MRRNHLALALLAVLAAVFMAGCGAPFDSDLKCAMNCGCYSADQWRNPTPDMLQHFKATPACQGTEVRRF